MNFAFLNLDPANLPDSAMVPMAHGARIFTKIVAAERGLKAPKIEFFPGLTVAPDGWIAVAFAATMDVPEALAYHSVDARGIAYIMMCLGVIPSGELFHDPSGRGECLFSALCHELAETMGDVSANFFAQGLIIDPATGERFQLASLELCDAVQGFSFPLTLPGGMVLDASDFLFGDFFNAALIGEAPRPLSYVARLTGGERGAVHAFTTSPGGYQSVAKVGKDGQIMAMRRVFHAEEAPAPWREEARLHPSRRSFIRVAGLPHPVFDAEATQP